MVSEDELFEKKFRGPNRKSQQYLEKIRWKVSEDELLEKIPVSEDELFEKIPVSEDELFEKIPVSEDELFEKISVS